MGCDPGWRKLLIPSDKEFDFGDFGDLGDAGDAAVPAGEVLEEVAGGEGEVTSCSFFFKRRAEPGIVASTGRVGTVISR